MARLPGPENPRKDRKGPLQKCGPPQQIRRSPPPATRVRNDDDELQENNAGKPSPNVSLSLSWSNRGLGASALRMTGRALEPGNMPTHETARILLAKTSSALNAFPGHLSFSSFSSTGLDHGIFMSATRATTTRAPSVVAWKLLQLSTRPLRGNQMRHVQHFDDVSSYRPENR